MNKSKKLNDQAVRNQLNRVLSLRREFRAAQSEVDRIGKLGKAEQKKFDALLLGKAVK